MRRPLPPHRSHWRSHLTIARLLPLAQLAGRALMLLARLVVVALVLLVALVVITFKLGCDHGEVEFSPGCVPPPIAVAPPVTLYQAGGTAGMTTVALHQGNHLVPVAEEPSQVLPGAVATLAVASPDQERVVYVTARDEMLTGATLMLADRMGTKRQLRTIEQGLWPTQPVWCQRQPGDPGRIAYVTTSEQSGGRAGLQLRVLTLGGTQAEDRVVVEGTLGRASNGFVPALFSGAHETPVQWWDNCNVIKYGDPTSGKRWLVDLRDETPMVVPVRRINLPRS